MKKTFHIDHFVINLKKLENIPPNSVGIIRALNKTSAMVFFIGENITKRVNFDLLKIINIYKTGKGYSHKICNICHILKPTAEFAINQTDVKGIKTTRPSCRTCRVKIDGAQLLPEEKKRLDKIKPPDGSIFECPICEKRSIVGVTANLVRDHDHTSGLAREWICDSCNTGLGRFKDNPYFLEKVIEYLKKHQLKK